MEGATPKGHQAMRKNVWGILLFVLAVVSILLIVIACLRDVPVRLSRADAQSVLKSSDKVVDAANKQDMSALSESLWEKSTDLLILTHYAKRKPKRFLESHPDLRSLSLDKTKDNGHIAVRLYVLPPNDINVQTLLLMSRASDGESNFRTITHGKYPSIIVLIPAKANGKLLYLPMIKEKGCDWKVMCLPDCYYRKWVTKVERLGTQTVPVK